MYDLLYRNISNIAKDLIPDGSFRSCYCGTIFKHCQDCLSGFCSIHNTLKCSGRCSTIFHMDCTDISIPICLPINLQNSVESNPSRVELYSMVDENNIFNTEWLCMKCKYEKISPVTLHFNEHFLFDNKCLKVGLMISSDITVSERKKICQDVDTLLNKLKDICPQQVYDNILNNVPKIFPSCTRISKIHAKKHALYGRRFETSMFSYDISTCHCCGRICIYHHDNLLLKYNCNIIKPRHFVSKKHDAWKCCCNNFCSGMQYYCSKRPSQITVFKFNHNGLLPWEFLNIPKNQPNASICDFCYNDTPDENGKYLLRRFFLYIYI